MSCRLEQNVPRVGGEKANKLCGSESTLLDKLSRACQRSQAGTAPRFGPPGAHPMLGSSCLYVCMSSSMACSRISSVGMWGRKSLPQKKHMKTAGWARGRVGGLGPAGSYVGAHAVGVG